MESNRLSIEDSATAWLQKRELGPWGASDHAELTQWLEASTAHKIAFLRLEAAWEEMGRLKTLAAGFPRHVVPTPAQLRLTPIPGSPAVSYIPSRWQGEGGKDAFVRSWQSWAAVAATLLLVSGLSIAYWQFASSSYRTPVGGLTSIPLEDGSSITLNTDSRVQVRMSKTRRHIELARGEAFFDVARDPARPFTVTAGDKAITAIGTAFSVRRDGSELRVVVTQGKVRMDEGSSTSPSTANAVIAAGSVAYAGATGVTVREKPLSEIDETLSWRTGYLIFHDTALPGVIAEFNRYNQRTITIEDPAINAIQLSGKFRPTNVDALVRLLEKSFRVNARRDGNAILLSTQTQASE